MSSALPDDWLLLRGLGRVAEHWHDFPDHLRAATDRPSIKLDLPGVGAASDEPTPLTIASNVTSLRQRWLAQRNSYRTCGIVAISLGGMVAVEWAHRHPEDFTHVVVIAASSALSAPWRRLRPGATAKLLRILLTPDPRRREELVLAMTTHEPARHRDALERAARINHEQPVPAPIWLKQLVAAIRWSPPPGLDVPTLLLTSQRDNMVHPSCSQVLAQRLRAALRLHPTAGHDLPLEDPHWITREIATWAAESPRPPGRGSHPQERAGFRDQ